MKLPEGDMKDLTSKIVVSGYYGYNNIGDEAILKGLLDGVGAVTDSEILVLSKNPDWTKLKYRVEAEDRSNVFQVLKAIFTCDMLISGGGSLLQDVTSKRSILYYLFIIFIAKIFRKKVFIYSQGIGPINLKLNRFLTKFILNRVDFINVRDNKSRDELINLGVKKDILVTTDTVFGIEKPSLESGKKIIDSLNPNNNRKKIGANFINWKDNGQRTIEEAVRALKIILQDNSTDVYLIPFYYHVDLEIARKIYDILKIDYKNIFLVENYLYVDEYLSLVGNMDLMVSMRLHGLIFSTLMGVYPIGISYDPKIDGFLRELKRPTNFHVEDFDGEKLAEEILSSLSDIDYLRKETISNLGKFLNLTSKHNLAVAKILN